MYQLKIKVLFFPVLFGMSFNIAFASDNQDVEKILMYINNADRNRNVDKENSTIYTKTNGNQITVSKSQKREILPDESKRVGIKKIGSKFYSTNIPNSNLIILSDDKTVKLSSKRKIWKKSDFSLSLPNLHNISKGIIASDSSIIYPDNDGVTDLAIQYFNDSARILTVLNSFNSPTEYEYHVNLPIGGEIKKDENGNIFVFDSEARLLGGFSSPWAIDKNGKKIPTHYEIQGNTVTQVIEHLGEDTVYPVVADPWLQMDLIYSAEWKTRSEGRSLFVYPTRWARSLTFLNTASTYEIGNAGFSELYSKYKNKGLTKNIESMRKQYICHQQLAPFKSSWNLDEWRPDTNYLFTLLQLCNPKTKI